MRAKNRRSRVSNSDFKVWWVTKLIRDPMRKNLMRNLKSALFMHLEKQKSSNYFFLSFTFLSLFLFLLFYFLRDVFLFLSHLQYSRVNDRMPCWRIFHYGCTRCNGSYLNLDLHRKYIYKIYINYFIINLDSLKFQKNFLIFFLIIFFLLIKI